MEYIEAKLVYQYTQKYRGKRFKNIVTDLVVTVEDIDIEPTEEGARVLFIVGPDTPSPDDMYHQEVYSFFATHGEVAN